MRLEGTSFLLDHLGLCWSWLGFGFYSEANGECLQGVEHRVNKIWLTE